MRFCSASGFLGTTIVRSPFTKFAETFSELMFSGNVKLLVNERFFLSFSKYLLGSVLLSANLGFYLALLTQDDNEKKSVNVARCVLGVVCAQGFCGMQYYKNLTEEEKALENGTSRNK